MWKLLAAIMAFGLVLPAVSGAATYTVTDLGTLGYAGGPYSYAYAINNSGQVTGYSYADVAGSPQKNVFLFDGTMHDLGFAGFGYGINDSGQVTGNSGHAFLYDGTMHDLGTLGGTSSVGYGINASGQVTGSSYLAGKNEQHAFLYDGIMHDLGTLGGTNSFGNGINASGQVAGSSNLAGDSQHHAFLYDGTMHDLGALSGGGSEGFAINASGQVTGRSNISPSVSHAILFDGTMRDLGSLGGNNSYSLGTAINASGQVTGFSQTANPNVQHAFLYDVVHGMVDLNSLINPASGWELFTAGGINDAGQITGWGHLNGLDRAFLLTPITNNVPEPASATLIACGLIALFAIGLRRRRLRSHA